MIDLEERLARYGDAIDALADVPEPWRLDAVPGAQVVPLTRVRRRPAVAIVAAVVVAALVVTALVATRRSDRPAPASPAPTWERLDMRDAGFARGASAMCCARIGNQLVAYGEQRRAGKQRGHVRFDAAIWTSDDGARWTRARIDDGLEVGVTAIARIDGHFVALSSDQSGRYWTSKDGRRWRAAVSPSLRAHRQTAVLGTSPEVVASNGRLVLVDEAYDQSAQQFRTRLAASSDGRTWKPLPDPPFAGEIAGFDRGLLGFQRSDPLGHSAPTLWFSPDGSSWTHLDTNLPLGRHLVVPDGQRDAVVIGWDGPGATGGHLYRSADGITWTEVASLREAFPNAVPNDVAYAGGWWIVAGWDTTVGRPITLWWSRDLEHWTTLPRRLQGGSHPNAGVVLGVGKPAVVAFDDAEHTIWRWARS